MKKLKGLMCFKCCRKQNKTKKNKITEFENQVFQRIPGDVQAPGTFLQKHVLFLQDNTEI